jgi:hypothetical protein
MKKNKEVLTKLFGESLDVRQLQLLAEKKDVSSLLEALRPKSEKNRLDNVVRNEATLEFLDEKI